MGLFGAKDSWRYFIGGELESRPSPLPLLAALASRSTTVRRSFVEDLVLLSELAATGEFRPVIDRIYALDDIVDAHRYVDNGHKRGNVVITVP
jgi:NADPH:quinone reductase-like Zn-dependent oxidoreductase